MKEGEDAGCGDKHHHRGAGFATSNKQPVDRRVRDYCLRTNLDLILLGLIVAGYSYHVDAAATDVDSSTENHETTSLEHQVERAEHAVFFPWFCQVIGIVVYYVLSRYARAIPFTAVMFLIGLCMGIAVEFQTTTKKQEHMNVVSDSTLTWMQISGELLLLIFLPGLLWGDAYGIDVHLFFKSLSQLLVMAFPLVLAGTALTACVAYYIFPYGWNFDLCMTFGAILSATDPVAVAVLMNELGAPPRLRMHISGESLLNDGSAYVFFNIFRARFLSQLNIPGVGENVGWGDGFKLFFHLSLGGMCIGIAFGVGAVVVLYLLRNRLSGEDGVAQVVLSISVAYVTYFVSELAGCSGIIGVLFVGITVKAFGENLINNPHLMHNFWEITEWLLNTLLFTLAGCVFGGMIVDSNSQTVEAERIFEPRDWGYLFALFFLLQAIRFILIFAFYPLISNIGIGSSLQEAVFSSYSGLRGAVGIALALSLTAEVYDFTQDAVYRDNSAKVFFLVGGVAMLTLIVNAPTCGPILKALGLVTPTETRLKIMSRYKQRCVTHCLTEYVSLLSDVRFHDLDFTVVREHVPFLKDVTYEQLKAAVKRHREKTPPRIYKHPNLSNVLPYLNGPVVSVNVDDKDVRKGRNSTNSRNSNRQRRSTLFFVPRPKLTRGSHMGSIFDLKKHPEVELVAHEERLIFLKSLRAAYHHLIEKGEVESRGFLPYSLFRSLDYASDKASRGQPLCDWEALCVASDSMTSHTAMVLIRVKRLFKTNVKNLDDLAAEVEHFQLLFKVQEILAFIKAHEIAEKAFREFTHDYGKDELTRAENVVLQESLDQVTLAEEALAEFDVEEVQQIKSHYACHIILSTATAYYERLSRQGLMSEREAGEMLEEIESSTRHVDECQSFTHAGELSEGHKKERMPTDDWSSIYLKGSDVITEKDEETRTDTV